MLWWLCARCCILVSRASCRLPARSAAMSSAVLFSVTPQLHRNYITTTSQLHQPSHHNYITTTLQLHHNYASLHNAIKRSITPTIYIKAPPPSGRAFVCDLRTPHFPVDTAIGEGARIAVLRPRCVISTNTRGSTPNARKTDY